MAYFDDFNKNIWNQLAESYELLNPYPLTDDDIIRSTFIAEEIISKYQERKLDKYPNMEFGQVLREASTGYFNLGLMVSANRCVSILKDLQFIDNQSYKVENLTVQSALVETGALVCKTPYYLEVPRVFNDSSVHFMIHEVSHILKESNPYECRGVYTDLEVVPILLELISALKNSNYNVFKQRESLMLDCAVTFKKLSEDLKNNLIKANDKAAFNACYRQNILYLNSFYYALKLFGMFLNDEEFVLELIDQVLNHRMTTKEVIDRYVSSDLGDLDLGICEFRSKLK